MNRTDYEVIIPSTGRVILTVGSRERAVVHAKIKSAEFGILHVQEVERVEYRRTIWKPRKVSSPTPICPADHDLAMPVMP